MGQALHMMKDHNLAWSVEVHLPEQTSRAVILKICYECEYEVLLLYLDKYWYTKK